MILETLSPTFLQFRTNYVMNHKMYNLTELLNELQTYETLIDDKGGKANVAEANVAEGKVFSSKDNKKKIVGKQKGKKKIQKRKKQGKSGLLVMETCLVENDFSSWIIDSGASNHVCVSLQIGRASCRERV